MTQFVHGKDFEDTWGNVLVLAEVHIEGKRLCLRGVAIYSLSGERSRLGVRALLQWRARICTAAREQGFETLRLEFDRLSGANPRPERVVVIDLMRA